MELFDEEIIHTTSLSLFTLNSVYAIGHFDCLCVADYLPFDAVGYQILGKRMPQKGSYSRFCASYKRKNDYFFSQTLIIS